MTDNEIIKALERYIVQALNNHDNYIADDLKNTLDLINRQKAEIERLKKPKVHMIGARGNGKTLGMYRLMYEQGINEFAEMLKNKMIAKHKNKDGFCVYEVDDEQIDNLVKEMTEV